MPRSMETMPEFYTHIIEVRDLKNGRENPFLLTPDADALKLITAQLGLLGLRKIRFKGAFKQFGKSDWRLEAKLGVTSIQACVITAEPVTTRIDIPVGRTFLKHLAASDDSEEIEFNGDDESEPLESVIDLGVIMTEAIALALPDYPRKDGAELGEAVFTAPGGVPLREEGTKPFASLAALKDKLKD